MTVDPLWPGERAFQYVSNMPVFAVDNTGLFPWAALGALVAGNLSCACAGYIAYNYYARDKFPYPNDDIGHCVAVCMIVTYLPHCIVFTPWASEMIGDFDWRDIQANSIGTVCGGIGAIRGGILPIPPWPPTREMECETCCRYALRNIWPRLT